VETVRISVLSACHLHAQPEAGGGVVADCERSRSLDAEFHDRIEWPAHLAVGIRPESDQAVA